MSSQPSLPNLTSKVTHHNNSPPCTFNDHFIKFPWKTNPGKIPTFCSSQGCTHMAGNPTHPCWLASHAAHGHEPQQAVQVAQHALQFFHHQLCPLSYMTILTSPLLHPHPQLSVLLPTMSWIVSFKRYAWSPNPWSLHMWPYLEIQPLHI